MPSGSKLSSQPQLTAIERQTLNRFKSEFSAFLGNTPFATVRQIGRFFQLALGTIYNQKSQGLLVAHGSPAEGHTSPRPRPRFHIDDVADWAWRTNRLRRGKDMTVVIARRASRTPSKLATHLQN